MVSIGGVVSVGCGFVVAAVLVDVVSDGDPWICCSCHYSCC